MVRQHTDRSFIRCFAAALILSIASMGCEDQQKTPPPKETASPQKAKKGGNPLDEMGKVIEGAGKILEGTGKVMVEGGSKVLDGTGKVIGGAGMAIGKAVGDVVVVALGPDTRAPDFMLTDQYNNRKIGLSDYRGQPVLLLFCMTNYAPCVVEMRHLRHIQEKYAEDGLRVLAIAMDWEGPAALRSFTEKMDLNYPLLWDNGTTFKKFTSLARVPTTFFITRKGTIWKKRIGFRSAMIITSGGQYLGSSMVEMDKDFEKDVVELLKQP